MEVQNGLAGGFVVVEEDFGAIVGIDDLGHGTIISRGVTDAEIRECSTKREDPGRLKLRACRAHCIYGRERS
ncbi:hypothetical protein GCM10027417_15710 [Glutamicibacter endophyticus]